jgi:hypothetical protein
MLLHRQTEGVPVCKLFLVVFGIVLIWLLFCDFRSVKQSAIIDQERIIERCRDDFYVNRYLQRLIQMYRANGELGREVYGMGQMPKEEPSKRSHEHLGTLHCIGTFVSNIDGDCWLFGHHRSFAAPCFLLLDQEFCRQRPHQALLIYSKKCALSSAVSTIMYPIRQWCFLSGF